MERTPFPQVFWIANTIEILERFAYYGIYFGFGIYTTLYGFFRDGGHPENVWYVLGGHMILGMIVLTLFTKTAGEFKEQEE